MPATSRLRSGDDRELRKLIPDQPVSADSRRIGEPYQRDAADPAEPAKTAEVSAQQLAPEVQQHDHDKRIGRVAVQAAHHAAYIPLLDGQTLHRGIRTLDTGIEKCVDVDPGDRNDPKQKKREILFKKGVFMIPDMASPFLNMLSYWFFFLYERAY